MPKLADCLRVRLDQKAQTKWLGVDVSLVTCYTQEQAESLVAQGFRVLHQSQTDHERRQAKEKA
jgi:hypothetical protein